MIVNLWTDCSIEKGHGVGGYVIKGMYGDSSNLMGTVDLGNSETVTSNQAEYAGVIGALTALKKGLCGCHEPSEINIYYDSKLIVEQCKDV